MDNSVALSIFIFACTIIFIYFHQFTEKKITVDTCINGHMFHFELLGRDAIAMNVGLC